ncbi:uncharacterized protein LOC128209116 [Mya arenaria]|uniref:uncharacterized protein LOC128209116 n=1 Tax=Mya arenaria TaxID=6604 RepID=UPI0022E0E885|nr:uncharacterized protein LOC128209116 [Mya arenaria]
MWSVLFGFTMFFVGETFGQNDEPLVIGAIASETYDMADMTFNMQFVTYDVIVYKVDAYDVYDVQKTVRFLDRNTTVDVIVLLELTPEVHRFSHVVLHTTRAPIIVWGDIGGPSSEVMATNLGTTPDNRRCGLYRKPADFSTSTPAPSTDNGLKDNLVLGKTLYSGPLVIASLVERLDLKYVIVIYENYTLLELSPLLDAMSARRVLYALYHVDELHVLSTDVKRSYTNLNGFTTRTQDKVDFVVLCRQACVNTVLKEANDFDSKYNANKTVLRNLSRWVVAVYGDVNLEEVKRNAFDLDNVLVVPVPEIIYDKHEVFTSSLRTVSLDVTSNVTLGLAEEPHADDWKRSFIRNLEQASEKVSTLAGCGGILIETLLWIQTGRDFSSVGYVTPAGELVLTADLFPNVNSGYNMRRFHVSVIEFPPYVIKVNNTAKGVYFTGWCIDILRELAITLNFTYYITEVPDNNYGVVLNRENMTFNGLVGQLQRNEVDLVVGDLATTRDREQVIDYTYPFHFGYTTAILKRENLDKYKWRKLLDPFKWQVIAVIGGTLVACAGIVCVMEQRNPFYIRLHETSAEEHNCRQQKCGFQTYVGAFSCLFASLFNEGDLHVPQSMTGRSFMSAWWLLSLVLSATYCGNLIAFLTVTKEKMPFDTLAQMAQMAGSYKWGTIGGTLWEDNFMTSENPTYKEVGNGIREFNKSDPTVLAKSPKFHVDRVITSENYAFIGDDGTIDIAIASNCDLAKLKERVIPLTNAFAFPDRSPHVSIFAEKLMSMHESGLMGKWKRRWWPQGTVCENVRTTAKPIQLTDVQSAFYIALIGLFLGFSTFLIEVIMNKRRRKI